MDAELKAKWIAALRSGEYEQAHEAMRRGDSYCCLGVLCVVAGRLVAEDEDDDTFLNDPNYDYCIGVLGEAVEKTCIGKNDGEFATFTQIADWLEAQP